MASTKEALKARLKAMDSLARRDHSEKEVSVQPNFEKLYSLLKNWVFDKETSKQVVHEILKDS